MYLKEKEEKKTPKQQVGCNQKNKKLNQLNKNEKDTTQGINEKKRFLLEKIKSIDKTLVKITKGEKPELISQIFIRFLQKKNQKKRCK